MKKARVWSMGLVIGVLASACGGRADRPPATASGPPPRVESPSDTASEPEPVLDDETSTTGRLGEDPSLATLEDPYDIRSLSLEEINADRPLSDVRFGYDSATLTDEARRILEDHAEWLLRYPTVTVLIEGHCDERGTVEYNLALGERRANAVFGHLTSLGVSASRMKTISYGKEAPLDPGHNEEAWARNRRAHFQITGK